jgi:hypothetical protein
MALLTAAANVGPVTLLVASDWAVVAAWASFVMVAVNATVIDRRVVGAEAIAVDFLIAPLEV